MSEPEPACRKAWFVSRGGYFPAGYKPLHKPQCQRYPFMPLRGDKLCDLLKEKKDAGSDD